MGRPAGAVAAAGDWGGFFETFFDGVDDGGCFPTVVDIGTLLAAGGILAGAVAGALGGATKMGAAAGLG